MPRKKLSPELKKAIINMPVKEKDSLLLRLITKDILLSEQLKFEVLEERSTLNDRFELLMSEMDQFLNSGNTEYPGILYLPYWLKIWSSKINHFEKITRDKSLVIELHLYLIHTILDKFKKQLQEENYFEFHKLAPYILIRMEKIKKMIKAVHADYQIEYAFTYNQIISLIDEVGGLHYYKNSLKPDIDWDF